MLEFNLKLSYKDNKLSIDDGVGNTCNFNNIKSKEDVENSLSLFLTDYNYSEFSDFNYENSDFFENLIKESQKK